MGSGAVLSFMVGSGGSHGNERRGMFGEHLLAGAIRCSREWKRCHLEVFTQCVETVA